MIKEIRDLEQVSTKMGRSDSEKWKNNSQIQATLDQGFAKLWEEESQPTTDEPTPDIGKRVDSLYLAGAIRRLSAQPFFAADVIAHLRSYLQFRELPARIDSNLKTNMRKSLALLEDKTVKLDANPIERDNTLSRKIYAELVGVSSKKQSDTDEKKAVTEDLASLKEETTVASFDDLLAYGQQINPSIDALPQTKDGEDTNSGDLLMHLHLLREYLTFCQENNLGEQAAWNAAQLFLNPIHHRFPDLPSDGLAKYLQTVESGLKISIKGSTEVSLGEASFQRFGDAMFQLQLAQKIHDAGMEITADDLLPTNLTSTHDKLVAYQVETFPHGDVDRAYQLLRTVIADPEHNPLPLTRAGAIQAIFKFLYQPQLRGVATFADLELVMDYLNFVPADLVPSLRQPGQPSSKVNSKARAILWEIFQDNSNQ